MQAGKLRHRVTLEQRSQAADGTVGLTTTYATVATVWAEVRQARPSIYLAGEQIGERVTHEILIRHRASTDFDHLSHGDRRFRVRGVTDPDGRGVSLRLACEELTPE